MYIFCAVFISWRHSEWEIKCHSLVARKLLHSQQWFSAVEFTKSLNAVRVSCLRPEAGLYPGFKIRWDICHLTTLTVILPVGFHKEQKNVISFFFLPQSIFEGKCFLRHFWATLNTVFCMMSKTVGKDCTEIMLILKVGNILSRYLQYIDIF